MAEEDIKVVIRKLLRAKFPSAERKAVHVEIISIIILLLSMLVGT